MIKYYRAVFVSYASKAKDDGSYIKGYYRARIRIPLKYWFSSINEMDFILKHFQDKIEKVNPQYKGLVVTSLFYK